MPPLPVIKDHMGFYVFCHPGGIMNDKQLFLNTVQAVMANHPDWFAETILSMQDGLVTRLDTEQATNFAECQAFVNSEGLTAIRQ